MLNISFKTVEKRELYHIGDLKNPSKNMLHGRGVTVSENPKLWKNYLRRDSYQIFVKNYGNYFVDYNNLTSAEKLEMISWAKNEGIFYMDYEYSFEASNGEEWFYTTLQSMEEFVRLQFGEHNLVNIKKVKKLKLQERYKRVLNVDYDIDYEEHQDILEQYAVSLYVMENTEFDGLWFNNRRNPLHSYGFIFNEKVSSYIMLQNTKQLIIQKMYAESKNIAKQDKSYEKRARVFHKYLAENPKDVVNSMFYVESKVFNGTEYTAIVGVGLVAVIQDHTYEIYNISQIPFKDLLHLLKKYKLFNAQKYLEIQKLR